MSLFRPRPPRLLLPGSRISRTPSRHLSRPAHPSPQPRETPPVGPGGSGSATGGGTVASWPRREQELSGMNPRQLSAHLDEFVVGQERAKKILAVAVYNHYTRLRHLSAPAPLEDPHSSSFSTLDHRAPLQPSPPRPSITSSTIQPRERHADGPLTFDPSYAPSIPPRRRKPAPPNPDPTLYDSDALPPTRRRTAESEILTDFIGQTQGVVPPAPVARREVDELVYEKSNVLLLGPTGSGKSLLARTLARCLDVPFVGVEATGMTMAGYVGEDVETCVHRLLVAADWDAERASRGIIFIDEIDKLARSSGHAKDVSGEGVQQALLKILEGTIVSVPDKDGGRRKGPPKDAHLVDTTNILFVLSGAFVGIEKMISHRVERGSIGFTARITPATPSSQALPFFTPNEGSQTSMLDLVEPADLVSFGFIPEFIGRLPVVATLRALSEADLLRVLTEPKNALVRQYEALFRSSGVDCRFTTAALREVAMAAVGKGTGARGLRRILEGVLLEAMYTAPQSSIRYVLIDQGVARGEKPAHYYSRGQLSIFESDFAAEESLEVSEDPEQQDKEVGNEEEEHEEEKRRATG